MEQKINYIKLLFLSITFSLIPLTINTKYYYLIFLRLEVFSKHFDINDMLFDRLFDVNYFYTYFLF